jgi:UDP-N-acetylmuramoyl-tripeptide--D-alanyl-D-alanine ligase
MATLAELQGLLPGATLVGPGEVRIERVSSDTRTLRAGDLFVALRGERHDAHDYLAAARAAGAAAALAERGLADAALPGLQVADTQAALSDLATAWRARQKLQLIAVTGSNGKTTVTQMIASILHDWLGDESLATQGNYNNHIGVPLTVLRLRQGGDVQHRAAVVELGMNHPGEIAELARVAQPTVALVNNAQREHQEFMASVEAVARENGSVITALPSTGVAVFPADDEHSAVWRELAGSRPTLTFAMGSSAHDADTGAGAGQDAGQGAGDTADVTCSAAWEGDHWAALIHTPSGEIAVRLHAPGVHNVRNALAAVTCALAVGCPMASIWRGLERFRPVRGRSQAESLVWRGRAITLVDDSYNANPDSMRAAIELLAGLPAPRWLVLGDMGEVGVNGPTFHAEVGSYAAERGIQVLWTAGSLAEHAARAFGPTQHFSDASLLVAALDGAPPAASVLVKGSRFMRMEQVVQALRERAAREARPPGGGAKEA